jgi:hypothetical protein
LERKTRSLQRLCRRNDSMLIQKRDCNLRLNSPRTACWCSLIRISMEAERSTTGISRGKMGSTDGGA